MYLLVILWLLPQFMSSAHSASLTLDSKNILIKLQEAVRSYEYSSRATTDDSGKLLVWCMMDIHHKSDTLQQTKTTESLSSKPTQRGLQRRSNLLLATIMAMKTRTTMTLAKL
ncbi:unnamed protein product [Citrullus colocynthis]|uniref:Uncharacterized protein n=1 Tax=Citrullus colocynthis TaxID=252529 RepID=A0ABP0YGU4_9ROSI